MYASRLAVLGAALVAALAPAAPASAAVTYDPKPMTGFVGAGDVQRAFGWTGPVLASRASGVVFDHEFWTDDTYTVACGGRRPFPVVHHREFGRFELTDAVVGSGYGAEARGFRLTGPHLGISGTSVPPAVGQPCPDGQGRPTTSAALV
jgi:hypothetical protein